MHESNNQNTLADYVELQRGTTYQSALLGKPGPVLLGLASIARNGGFRPDNLKTYGGNSDPRILLFPGDLYVSLKDVTQSADLLGAIARLPDYIASGRLTQDTVKLVFKNSNSSQNYIYWLLQTPQYREYCRAHATGTTNLGLPRDDFLAFPVPPLSIERQTLLTALQAIEDKIELNRRMNENLEAMARAIFKDWFVDFGPTRAKIEGRAPYLAPVIWRLFPGDLDAVGMPEGWSSIPLIEVCQLKRGYDLPSQSRVTGPIPIISSSGPTGWHSGAMARGPGIVTGRYGTIGQVFTCKSDFWPLNTTLYVCDFKGHPYWFVYHTLLGLDFTKYSDKAAVPGVNRNALHMERVTTSSPELLQRFEATVAPLMSQAAENADQLESLTALRNLLLPKLMSGELRIKDTEKMVGEPT